MPLTLVLGRQMQRRSSEFDQHGLHSETQHSKDYIELPTPKQNRKFHTHHRNKGLTIAQARDLPLKQNKKFCRKPHTDTEKRTRILPKLS